MGASPEHGILVSKATIKSSFMLGDGSGATLLHSGGIACGVMVVGTTTEGLCSELAWDAHFLEPMQRNI